jgi:protein-disulfide isomerase
MYLRHREPRATHIDTPKPTHRDRAGEIVVGYDKASAIAHTAIGAAGRRQVPPVRIIPQMDHNDEISALLADIPQSANALGQPAAPVTLEYFGDLQCPYCRDFALGVLASLVRRWVRAGQLRIESRALQAATRDPEVFVAQQVAALAAGEQRKAWHFIETFYDQQGAENTGYVTDAYLQGIAGQIVGLDVGQWASDRRDPALAEQIVGDERDAESAGLHRTPSFLVGSSGGTMTRLSATDLPAFDAAIEERL